MPTKKRLEYSDGKSSKFWEIELEGTNVTVVYGKIGTNGVTQLKTFGSIYTAFSYYNTKVKEKLRKGYVEPSAGTIKPKKKSNKASEAIDLFQEKYGKIENLQQTVSAPKKRTKKSSPVKQTPKDLIDPTVKPKRKVVI